MFNFTEIKYDLKFFDNFCFVYAHTIGWSKRNVIGNTFYRSPCTFSSSPDEDCFQSWRSESRRKVSTGTGMTWHWELALDHEMTHDHELTQGEHC